MLFRIATPSSYRDRGSSIRVGLAQPCPACIHGAMPIAQANPKSASSKTIVADLPPSSRNSRFMVAAPFSMIRLPTTVDPGRQRQLLAHKVIRRGHDVHDTGGDISLFGDQPTQPIRVERSVRRRLEHDGVAGA